MELLLTDRLSCPRCGPAFGLILLANHMAARRVQDGQLGCPNCRDAFPIREGFADLRAPPRGPLQDGLAGLGLDAPERVDEAERAIALLGVARGPGTVALVGAPARFATRLVARVDHLQAVAVDADARAWPEHEGVSRIVASPGLPFFSRTLRGVVVDGRLGSGVLFEAARVTAPMSRVVVVDAPEDSTSVLEEGGLHILAEEAETVVAARG